MREELTDPAWDSRALPILQNHAGQLQQVNPVWYLLTEDGTIEPVFPYANRGDLKY